MRYKLIPAQGMSNPGFIEAEDDARAVEIAKSLRFQHNDQAILVFRHPEGGLVTAVTTVGAVGAPKRKAR